MDDAFYFMFVMLLIIEVLCLMSSCGIVFDPLGVGPYITGVP